MHLVSLDITFFLKKKCGAEVGPIVGHTSSSCEWMGNNISRVKLFEIAETRNELLAYMREALYVLALSSIYVWYLLV